jgi:hypothetical protein
VDEVTQATTREVILRNCRAAIESAAGMVGPLQHATAEDAEFRLESLGTFLAATGDAAAAFLAAVGLADETEEHRCIRDCYRLAVGTWIVSLHMCTAIPSNMRAQALLAAIEGLCETHGLDPEDCEKYVTHLDMQVGEGRVVFIGSKRS